jgi:hypothetical protein
MCSTVRNAKESYNEHHQAKALVPIAHVTDSAAHAHSLQKLVRACNSVFQLHVHSIIRTCTCVCGGHHCFDLAEHVVALFCISNNAAHICGLSYSHTYAVAKGDHIYRVLKHAQVCMTNIDPHLLQSQTMGGCGVCQILAKLFFLNCARTRFSESAVNWVQLLYNTCSALFILVS